MFVSPVCSPALLLQALRTGNETAATPLRAGGASDQLILLGVGQRGSNGGNLRDAGNLVALHDKLQQMVKRRLSAEEARECAKRAARVLADDPRVQLVYLFGSAVDPDESAVRDLDLALLANPSLSLEELVKLRADLVRDTGLEIDLVALNDASVVLAHEVVEHGICLWCRDPDIETEFVVRTRARYWDFKPFLDEQWRLAGERLKKRVDGS